MKKALVLVFLAATVGALGCVGAPGPAPVASANPGSGETAAPPSPVPTATSLPSAAPSAAPALSLGEGTRLKPYNFRGIGGVYRDPILDQLYVVDAKDDAASDQRYVLRKFNADGTFVSTAELAPSGGQEPDAVDGVAFDYRGFPVFSYREDESFRLHKLVTATVTSFGADDYPLIQQARAGATTVSANGNELYVAVISLERDETLPDNQQSKTDGKLMVAHAEEDMAAKSLFQIPDPLYPTVRMAFAPNGSLYLAGPNREGKQQVVRVDADQKVTGLPVALGAVPDGLWVSPQGKLWLGENRQGGVARLRRFGPDGASEGEAELRLAGGGQLTTLQGLVFDSEGRALVAGKGFDAASRSVEGLFLFGRPE